MDTLYVIASYLVPAVDPVPASEDIKAGWGALGLFLMMAVSVGLLGWSLTRHLKKTKQNADAGLFGDVEPAEPAEPAEKPAAG